MNVRLPSLRTSLPFPASGALGSPWSWAARGSWPPPSSLGLHGTGPSALRPCLPLLCPCADFSLDLGFTQLTQNGLPSRFLITSTKPSFPNKLTVPPCSGDWRLALSGGRHSAHYCAAESRDQAFIGEFTDRPQGLWRGEWSGYRCTGASAMQKFIKLRAHALHTLIHVC